VLGEPHVQLLNETAFEITSMRRPALSTLRAAIGIANENR